MNNLGLNKTQITQKRCLNINTVFPSFIKGDIHQVCKERNITKNNPHCMNSRYLHPMIIFSSKLY